MNTVTIGEILFPKFQLIFTDEAIARLSPGPKRQSDTFALGVIDNEMPLGAIVVKCSPPTAEVISFYVVEEFRRLGIGSSLLFEALTDVMALPEISEFVIPYTEAMDEDLYSSFFEGIEMDVIEVGAEYRIKASDALSSSLLLSHMSQEDIPVYAYEELLSTERKMLFLEGAGLYDYFLQGKIREDLVFVVMDESRRNYKACIAFVEEDDELILAWLHVENSPMIMMELLHRAMKKVEENGEQDKIIRIPTINSVSDAIVQKLFPDKSTPTYYAKQAVFTFE